MSLIFDQKEDLRTRMADLQHKLAESEEERKKLEKTCNILMRAFREEEKMHYKALNNRYEQFLEDCKVRRRRNDIILRLLCRVEDRARALFARTERLKVLKDRYITYLRPNNLKNTETSSLTWKAPVLKAGDEVNSKFVHWKTPHVADLILNPQTRDVNENREKKILRNERLEQDLAQNFESDYPNLYKSFTERYYQRSPTNNIIEEQGLFQNSPKTAKESILSKILQKKELPRPLLTQNKPNPNESHLLNSEPSDKFPTNLTSKQFSTYKEGSNNYTRYGANTHNKYNGDYNKEKVDRADVMEDRVNSDSEMEFKDLKKVTALREKGVIKHQESIEKLKTALSFEDDVDNGRKDNEKSFVNELSPYRSEEESNQKIIEKDEIETNEKSEGSSKNESRVREFPRTDKENMNNQHSITSSPKTNLLFTSFVERDDPKFPEWDKDNNVQDPNSEFAAPKSLDGVDYQNETYPESYYEQPVHQHSYSSIASNVILEEDEYEQEADQPEEGVKNVFNKQNGTYGKTLPQVEMLERDNAHRSSFSSSQSPSRSIAYDEPYGDDKLQRSTADKRDGGQAFPENEQDQFRGRDSGSEKSAVVEKHDINTMASGANESKSDGSVKKFKNIGQSNLAHLLESDSESFQIEHGDLNSANEDSDFDFSFHQN